MLSRRVALASVFILLACAASKPPTQKERKPPPPQPTTVVPKLPDVDKLVSEQKLSEAVKLLDQIVVSSKKSRDDMRLVLALTRRASLQMALGAAETAVGPLHDAERPKSPVPDIALELFYASTLTSYIETYSYEIGQREQVVQKPGAPFDLKTMSKDELVLEAQHAYQRLWTRRDEVASWKLSTLGSFIDPNNYPDNVRGTLRDTMAYLAVQELAASNLWSAKQSNELYRVGVDRLLGNVGAVPLDGDEHPLVKAIAVLDDLERFHADAGRKEGALEARLERLRRLHEAFPERSDRHKIEDALTARLATDKDLAWSAMGIALRAQWFYDANDRVAAHDLVQPCASKYAGTLGGQSCQHLLDVMEEPTLAVRGMAVDALGKPSIAVDAHGLPRVYFRAYAYDAAGHLGGVRDYDPYPEYQVVQKLLSQKPTATWTSELVVAKDWQSHVTYVVPPLQKKGFYVVLASNTPDFKSKGIITGVHISLSDLVLTTRDLGNGQTDARVFDGPSGHLVEGADIEVWRPDYERGHHKVGGARTDKDGHATLSTTGSFFFIVRKGSEVTFAPETRYSYVNGRGVYTHGALVYTDRTVYRPNQTLDWKIVAYEGKYEDGHWKVSPNASIRVRLFDANGQEVQHVDVKTGAYGSANGTFTIPAGRALGAWRVDAGGYGNQSIRVEEYKRPTFEVSLEAPDKSLALNEPAKLKGEARYYFGQPVTGGTARYTVTRQPVYPYWWGWYHAYSISAPQTVARGSSKLSADGTFDVEWKPEVATSEDHDVTYSYQIAADVTDEGGETRSASRGYRLGFTTVEATLASEASFFEAGKSGAMTLRRADLDGTPRPGKGTFHVSKLEGPKHALLPAEQPSTVAHDDAHKPYPSDLVRPRWETSYDPETMMAQWKDGAEVKAGALDTATDGSATLTLPALPAGAYRVRYETVDDKGQKATTFRDVLVGGGGAPVQLPAIFEVAEYTARVGDTARLLVETALLDQTMVLERYRNGITIDRKVLTSPNEIIELPITEADRGGLAFSLVMVRDHQRIAIDRRISVPWDNQALTLSFSTFRDTMRPGAHETFRVTVESDGKHPQRLAGGAELLAYMYDRSLDLFAPHSFPSPLSMFPTRTNLNGLEDSLGQAHSVTLQTEALLPIHGPPSLHPDSLSLVDGYGIGGLGLRGSGYGGGGMAMMRAKASPVRMLADAEAAPPPPASPMPTVPKPEPKADRSRDKDSDGVEGATVGGLGANTVVAGKQAPAEPPRSNFAETAFWQPALVVDSKGEAGFEFTVPDSVTSWNVWVHALTKDLRSGSIEKQTRSVKELMVRPYLPRFLREGDTADIEVVVNNAGKGKLDGTVTLAIEDPATHESRVADFKVQGALSRPVSIEAGKSTHVAFSVTAPKRLDTYAFTVRATARSGGETLSDGELRPLPILPSRLHLTQSRFVTLKDADKREMQFAELAKNDDPSRVNEQMVVTLDAQLFFTVLRALPYLIEYPYECAEQTLNRFLSTGIVTSLFDQYPQIAKMADQMSKRTTQLQSWDAGDANRKVALEETPFLAEARGDGGARDPLINVLDGRVARANRDSALDKLRRMQLSSGGFPWFPGGRPSEFMTLYVLDGFARAAEFKVDVPKDMVQRGWAYLARNYATDYARQMLKDDCCWEYITFLNYVAGAYPDESWTGGAITPAMRKNMLDHSFKHWKQSSPRIKALLALTLKRMGRAADAKLVWDSVMDSAKTEKDKGTFWAQEDRSWLWYNDTIESHAFALRTLLELDPKSDKQDGLVLWLLLNKKLNQWKSTRATAEVLYSLATYMKANQSLGVREAATVNVGTRSQTFAFEPDRYVGKVQLLLPGNEVSTKNATITVGKETKGVMFASATWSFATDKMPTEGDSDFFSVRRHYFRRENDGTGYKLTPLADGAALKLGDEVDVEVQIATKHEAEYVHLRDPRGAGFEPTSQVSHWGYDLGLSYYEEVRDSGENFFFERLPVGQYTFHYRIRATTAGTFRVGPATLQSMYAPEFNAYSAGHVLKIGGPN